jgi:hypothetical protein
VGTEAFWIPAALAAVSAGGQYVNQKQAASRQDQGEAQAIRDQQQIQQEAAGKASALTKQITTNTPTQIANQATGDYVSNLRKNAAGASAPGASSALAPAAGGSARYNKDVSTAQSGVGGYGNDLAGTMGQIDAAVRQRQNEGLAQQTLGTNLNTLGAQSYTKNFVDQLRAQASGVANPWVGLASKMVGALGTGLSASGAFEPGVDSSLAGSFGSNAGGTAGRFSNSALNNLYSVD